MSCVYITLTSNNKYYLGGTNNLNRRIIEHSLGRTKSLKYLLPIKLVFVQEYPDIRTARKIEAKLKKFKSRKIIEQIIKDGKIKISI